MISLPKIPYIHRIYMVLANPTYVCHPQHSAIFCHACQFACHPIILPLSAAIYCCSSPLPSPCCSITHNYLQFYRVLLLPTPCCSITHNDLLLYG